jgi:hypothetical protein
VKFSDRNRFVAAVRELTSGLRGELIEEEGDLLVASLPALSMPEFERRLDLLSQPPAASPGIRPPLGKMSPVLDRKSDTLQKEKDEESDRQRLVSIRIRLIRE